MEQPAQPAAPYRRRSQRLLFAMRIEVRGVGEDHHPFREETQTLVINAHGALIGLAHPVEVGQQIVLKNPKSQEMQACRVVHSGTADSREDSRRRRVPPARAQFLADRIPAG